MIRACAKCGTKNRVPAARLHQTPRCGKCKSALGPIDHPVPLRDAAAFDELIGDSKLPVLVDFWAAWCGPCRMVAPEMEKLARDKANAIVVAKLDTEANPSVAARFQITGIPTMILFEGGKEAKRLSGAMPAAQIAAQLGI